MDHSKAAEEPRRRGISLTTQIFIGLAIGVVVGAIVDATNPAWAVYFRPFSQLFLRLIKMIIAPLIFATLVAGIAGAGHFKVVGRMGEAGRERWRQEFGAERFRERLEPLLERLTT